MSDEHETASDGERKIRFKLEANDENIVEVDEDVACQCLQLKQMIEHLGITDPDDPRLQEPMHVGNVNGPTLLKIMEWCTEHRGEEFVPKPEDEDQRTVLTARDEEWLNVSNRELMDLLMGANFLDIPGMIDIITQKIANMLSGKTSSQMRQALRLDDDLPRELKSNKNGWI